jgi:ADP-ribose pyrophosphatase
LPGGSRLDSSRVSVPLVSHPESVTIVPLDGDDVVLVSQTRRGAGKRVLELPAGTLEPGETPVRAAKRELAEECGLEAGELTPLGGFWVVPAYSTEYSHVFLATELSPVDSPGLDQDEDIEVERVPAGAAVERVEDAGSLAALALWRGV